MERKEEIMIREIYKKVFKINNTLVIGEDIEEATALYRKAFPLDEIKTVELQCGGYNDYDALFGIEEIEMNEL